MMQVEKDIIVALDFIKGNMKKVQGYAPVRLFPTYSLKCFNEYKLNKKSVLTKYNSGDEELELLSYGANVTCYSSNRLDEYFLNLRLALLLLDNKQYFSYFFKDYGKDKHEVFSKELYSKVRESLDEKTRYFFDELFRCAQYNILKSKLVLKNGYSYKHLRDYIRYYICHIYTRVQDNLSTNNVQFKLSSDFKIPLLLDGEKFNFINLLYDADAISEERLKFIMDKINTDFKPMLTEGGSLQGFISRKNNEIEGYTKLEKRSLESSLSECKKQYIYVYTNK